MYKQIHKANLYILPSVAPKYNKMQHRKHKRPLSCNQYWFCAAIPLQELFPKLIGKVSPEINILDEEQLLLELRAGRLQIAILTYPVTKNGLVEERMSFADKKPNRIQSQL